MNDPLPILHFSQSGLVTGMTVTLHILLGDEGFGLTRQEAIRALEGYGYRPVSDTSAVEVTFEHDAVTEKGAGQ